MTDRWIDVDGCRIHYLFGDGSGPDLVVLPGGVLDSATLSWKKVVEALPDGYRVFVIELPGFGRSELDPRVEAGTSRYAWHVRTVLLRLGISRPVLFATSMSGAVALELVGRDSAREASEAGSGRAAAHVGSAAGPGAAPEAGPDAAPLDFRALVLSGAYGFQSRMPFHKLVYALSRIRSLAAPVRRTVQLRSVMRMALRFVVHDPDAIDDELVDDALREAGRDHALDAFFEWLYHEVRPGGVVSDYRQDVPRMHVPTCLIHGAHDWMMPPQAAREATARFPDAELHVLETGHMVPREQTGEVNRIVHAFLRKHAPLG